MVFQKVKNFDKDEINFSKKLLDVFNPEVMHVEVPPKVKVEGKISLRFLK